MKGEKVYVCFEWAFDDNPDRGELRIVKVVKNELSAKRWCGCDDYKSYKECELEGDE